MTVSTAMRERVRDLLGREPRGLEEVAVVSESGNPMVIRVASLVEDTPFPTLFWLVDPQLSLRIDAAEARGVIKQLQERVDGDEGLQHTMRLDHMAHIALREHYMSSEMKARIHALGYTGVFRERGIGGIADFSRVRCLHTWYASHLVVPNTIGELLEQWWQNGDQFYDKEPNAVGNGGP
ncbi:MAG: DUF501 domain-containing protein [Pseudomonadota bacterium]